MDLLVVVVHVFFFLVCAVSTSAVTNDLDWVPGGLTLGSVFDIESGSVGGSLMDVSPSEDTHKGTITLGDVKYRVPDFFNRVERTSCSSSSGSFRTATSISEYIESRTMSVGVEVSFMSAFKASVNVETRAVQTLFENEGTHVFEYESDVCVYTAYGQINLYDFSSEVFREMVADVPAVRFNPRDNSHMAKFDSLVSSLGGAFVVTEIVGGGSKRIQLATSSANRYSKELGYTRVQARVGVALAEIISGSVSTTFTDSNDKVQQELIEDAYKQTHCIGGDTSMCTYMASWTRADQVAWHNSALDQPGIIEYKVKPVSILLPPGPQREALRDYIAHRYGMDEATEELTNADIISGAVDSALAGVDMFEAANRCCHVYFGWRDECEYCNWAPYKWGKTGGNTCSIEESGSGHNSCLRDQQNDITWLAINTDGKVDGNDKFYVAFKCDEGCV